MNHDRAIFIVNDDVRCVLVSYDGDWTYSNGDSKPPPRESWKEYKTLNPDIKVGDYVVIPTHTRYGMTVCRVEEVDHEPDLENDQPMNWIIGTVDRSEYETVLTEENSLVEAFRKIEKEKKRQELRKTLVAGHEEKLQAISLANPKRIGDK